jgi:hypothetical protein
MELTTHLYPVPSVTTVNVRVNVTLRRVRATIVAVEKQWLLYNLSVCICSLSYPACNAHAPYCYLWPVPLYNVFPHYHINDTILERKMCCLIFSTTFI